MSGWNLRYGRWWMIQWQADGWFSLGLHLDFRRRRRADGIKYGPYLDVHLGWVIFSVGRNPAYSGDLDKLIGISRGGI
jgi:hypothetical protein